MRELIFLCAAVILVGSCVAFKSEKLKPKTQHVKADNIFEGTFRTRVNHYHAQDGRTVDFTYHANFDFTEEAGPVFIYLKDGGDYTTQWIESGLMVDIARATNGSLFTFDYRYFGTNQPTPTASFEDMQFLTTEQILSDVAQFVTSIRALHDIYGSQVIVYGTGYGGTIATWARKKFPHIINAAWSSSGIFDLNIASLNVYDSLSYSIYRVGGLECRDLIQEAFEEAERLILSNEADELQTLFNLCNPIDTESTNDISAFFQDFYDFLVLYVQENHGRGVINMCEDLEESTLEPLEAFAAWATHVFGGSECYDHSYATRIELRSNPAWNQIGTITGRRQWHYIQCTQTGLFQITDDWTWLPNWVELIFHINKCRDVLGEDYEFDLIRSALENLRNQYGSLFLRSSNTIYTNGDIDPKMYNGIIYTNDLESIALNVELHGKASDTPSIQETDSAQLQYVKEQIVERITNFSNPYWI